MAEEQQQHPAANNAHVGDDDLHSLSKDQLVARVRNLEAKLKQLDEEHHPSQQNKKVKSKKPDKQARSFDFSTYRKRHLALKFLYLGWNFDGFVVQDNTSNTIEDALFNALEKIKLIENRQSSNYQRCGRTDIGVSAFSQVVSLDVRSNARVSKEGEILQEDPLPLPSDELNYTFLLNRVLPKEIRCIAWSPVDSSFSARFNCRLRSYRYFFPRAKLNIDAMKEASLHLLGEHNFQNFCKLDEKNKGKTIRTISAVNLELVSKNDLTEAYDIVCFSIQSQGFLWHQIRCIMTVLFLVGEGKETPDVVKNLLDMKKFPLKPQYQLASGLPLVLYDCVFDNDDISSWHTNAPTIKDVIETLQSIWTENSIKAQMTLSMIFSLDETFKEYQVKNIEEQASSLQEEKSKEHKLLSLRPFCTSTKDIFEVTGQ